MPRKCHKYTLAIYLVNKNALFSKNEIFLQFIAQVFVLVVCKDALELHFSWKKYDNLQNFRDLKNNLFNNVSKWVFFFWQVQIQTIKYDLNDTKIIKKKQDTLILYSFTPSDMNFQTFLLPTVILAKLLSQKTFALRPFLS